MKKTISILSLALASAAFAAAPSVDFSRTVKPFEKALHGSNTGYWLYPVRSGKEAEDAALMKSVKFTETRTDDWGNTDRGEPVIDLDKVFPLIHRDASNNVNYVFTQTDDIIDKVRSSAFGSMKVCYRLGNSDDKSGLHMNSLMPTNFNMMAAGCAGIVRHLKNKVARWEIWDSPDDADRNWWAPGLTSTELRDQFAEFYATVLKRLRDEFGNTIIVGGPGLTSYKQDWFAAIITACNAKGVKPDFLSYRYFGSNAASVKTTADTARSYLDGQGWSDVGLALDAWHWQTGTESTAAAHGFDSGLFTAKVLASLPYTPFKSAYYYGADSTGKWSLFNYATDHNRNFLKLFGEVAANSKNVVAAESSSATSVFGATDEDGESYRLYVVNSSSGSGAVTVSVAGLEGSRDVAATVVDSSNDGKSVAATYANGVLTLPKLTSGSAAWSVKISPPPPAVPTLQVSEPHDGRITVSFPDGVATNYSLLAVYAPHDAGEGFEEWSKVEYVSALTNGMTSVDCTLPSAWGVSVGAVRFVVVDFNNIPARFLDGAIMDVNGQGAAKPQWFNTGVEAKSSTKCEVDFTPSALGARSEWLFASAANPSFEVYHSSTYYPGYAYGGNANYASKTGWPVVEAGVRAVWKLDGKNKTFARGSNSATFTTSWSGVGDSIMIGRAQKDANYGMLGTIHSVKIEVGATTITKQRDLIPAQVRTVSGGYVTGFYDKLHAKFYKSSGSADFVAGNVIDYTPALLGVAEALAVSAAVETEISEEPIGPHDHIYSDWITNAVPTCVVEGSRYRDCTVTGCDEREYETIPAFGHSFGAWTVYSTATLFAPGEERRTCSACGANESRAIPALKPSPSMVPAGYQVVDYIEGTGTQYIDTGIAAQNKNATKIDFSYTSVGSSYMVAANCLNSSNSRSNRDYLVSVADGGIWRCGIGSDSAATVSTPSKAVANTRYWVEASVNSKVFSISVSNVVTHAKQSGSKTFTVSMGTQSSPTTLTIFALHSSNVINFSSAKLYYCEILTNLTTRARVYYPCYQNSSGKYGLYDVVTGTFVSSGSSTEFTGPSVEPPTPHEHTPVNVEAVPATCTEPGLSAGVKCSECDQWITEPVVMPALGHDWSAWETNEVASVGHPGQRSRTCSRCYEWETEEIPPEEEPFIPGDGISTNAMTNASWGYELRGLGAESDEVALVFTNTTETMNLTLPDGVDSIWYLVVAGGGSGGTSYADDAAGGGGGGAGGMLEAQNVALTGASISVKVGAGGAAVKSTSNSNDKRPSGKNGGDSTLTFNTDTTITAHGGGGGAGGAKPGEKGGSGGGALKTGDAGSCYADEGNVGGTSASGKGGGGGGGKGAAGSNATGTAGAKGGNGAISLIGAGCVAFAHDSDGNDYFCAGGGGGSCSTSTTGGSGGTGGGGKGGKYEGAANAAGSASNYGCGGGGTNGNGWHERTSGAGFQGVVIIRYKRSGSTPEVQPPVIGGGDGAAIEVTADGFKVRIDNYSSAGSYGYQESDTLVTDWSALEIHPLPAPVDGVFTIPWGDAQKPANFYRIVVE